MRARPSASGEPPRGASGRRRPGRCRGPSARSTALPAPRSSQRRYQGARRAKPRPPTQRMRPRVARFDPMRRGLAWLFALPLMLVGSQAAHVFAYRWVYPSSDVRLHALFVTGHGYLDRLPFVLAAGGAVALVALLFAAADAARGRRVARLPAAAFALLPPVAFVLQEVLERSVHSGTFFWQAVEAPTFIPGLLLQLPFAIVAYLVARVLLRAAERAGRALAAAPPRVAFVVALQRTPPHPVFGRRRSPLAHRLAQRGPPPLLA